MIQRIIASKILELRNKFPVLSLTGPRQTGKTTLLKSVYADLPYVTLEDIDSRIFALEDPRGFLGNYKTGAILDEVQQVPHLFSYLQGIVDKGGSHFVLSGSQNFLLSEKITQSLAGRTAVLKLLPFSLQELKPTNYRPVRWEEFLFQGGYPRLYDKQIQPVDFYPSYINTYIEKDVRQIKSIENLNVFSTFIKLCAGRTGQILNIQSLANDAGVSPNTVKAWLSVLESSYIIYLLYPHHQNFNKRLTKAPKLFFYDTGVACSLLGIEQEHQLTSHYLKGGLFENLVINEFLKYRTNQGLPQNISFWLSKEQKEIDLLIDKGTELIPIEIKAGKTRNPGFFDNLKYWQKISGTPSDKSFVVYGGDEEVTTTYGKLVTWNNLDSVFYS